MENPSSSKEQEGSSNTNPLKRKRQSYSAELKLEVVSYAEVHGNREAGRLFEVNEKSVRQWRLAKNELNELPAEKRARRTGKTSWPELEAELLQWIVSECRSGRSFSTSLIRMKAQSIASEMEIKDFKGGVSWCVRFMKRHDLTVGNLATVVQSTPDNVDNTT